MSSFISHSLAAMGVYSFARPRQRSLCPAQSIGQKLWLGWLVAIASLPDIDYLIPALQSSAHQGARITHSIGVSLLLPVLTIVVLRVWGTRRQGRNAPMVQIPIAQIPMDRIAMVQLVGAGLSHLVLDLLVGVKPLPLLWPLSTHPFRLSFGILPSAGRLVLSNYYFYRNLVIEMGVLLPLFYGLHLIRQRAFRTLRQRVAIALLFLCSASFMYWAACLPR